LYSNLKVAQKGLILVLVLVVLPLAFSLLLAAATLSTLQGLAKEDERQLAILNVNRIGSICSMAATLAIGGRQDTPEFRKALAALDDVQNLANTPIGRNIREYPELQEAINHAAMMRKGIDRFVNSRIESDENPTKETKLAKKSNRQTLLLYIIEFSDLAKQLGESESGRTAASEPAHIWIKALVIPATLGFVFLAIAIFLFQKFSSDIRERLEVVSENSRRLATGEPLAKPIKGRDEIASLDAVIHGVSESLQDIRRQELSILDNATDVICSLNDKLKFTAVNPASANLWKYSPEELLGMPLVSLLCWQAESESLHKAFQLISSGEGEGKIDTTLKCKDGSLRDFRWTITWSKTDHNYSCVVQDISQQKEMARLKQQFTLMVSHDLRSPLTALTMSFGMCLDGVRGPITEGQRTELERVQSSMSRLMELINDLLELGKLESGSLIVQSQRIRAYNVCAEAIESLERMASAAKIRLERPKNDVLMLGEERRILQATLNLLSNSIKFAPANSTVTLEVGRVDGFAEIRITDKGPGVPLEDRALIFDKFSQSTATSNLKIKSSGLGLAIVKAIVTAHGGIVGLDSEVGKGSSFWFRIPAYEGPNEDEDL
jgi:PAS domain S-box-containing protein